MWQHDANLVIFQPQEKILKQKDLLFLDFETTGLNAETDQILQVAIGWYEKQGPVYVLKTESWFVRPDNLTLEQSLKQNRINVLTGLLRQQAFLLSAKDKQLYNFQKTGELEKDYKLVKQFVLAGKNAAQFKLNEKNSQEFFQHWNEITTNAYKTGISQAENQAKLEALTKDKVLVTYNGINFDQTFLRYPANFSNLDVLKLAQRYLRASYTKTPVLMRWTDSTGQEKILPDLKQNTVGIALACENINAHDAENDIRQLAFIFNKLLKMAVLTLKNNDLIDDETKIPLTAFTNFDEKNYLSLIQTPTVATVSKLFNDLALLAKQKQMAMSGKHGAKDGLDVYKFRLDTETYIFALKPDYLQILKDGKTIFKSALNPDEFMMIKTKCEKRILVPSKARLGNI